MVVVHLGWVDSDLGSSPSQWAVTAAICCPTGGWNILNLGQPNPGARPPWSHCTNITQQARPHSQFQSPHTAMAINSHAEMGIASKEDGSVTVMTTAVTIRMNNIALGTMDNQSQLIRHNCNTNNIHILIFG